MKKLSFIIGIFFICLNLTGQTIPKWKMSVLDEYIKTSDQPVIINFWATYCGPCLEEIPYFLELSKKYEEKGVKLMLVSLDFAESYPDKIRNFSVKRKFTAPIVWLDETDADYFCPIIDNSWSGAMPATLFVNNKTGFRSFYEEKISREKLEEEINKLISTQ